MNLSAEQNIIERDIHCPYCKQNHALLISGVAQKRSTFGLPDYGLKYWLSVYFTFGLHIIIHGISLFESKKSVEYQTYGFCPLCGRSYNANVPGAVKSASVQKEKLYLSDNDRLIFGICGGIAEFTELPPVVVRGVAVIKTLLLLIAALAFLVGLINGAGSLSKALETLSSLGTIPFLSDPVVYFLLGIFRVIPTRPARPEVYRNEQ